MTIQDVKQKFFTEEEMCEFLRVTRKTMAHRRHAGRDHPPFIKIGKTILYPKKDFDAWLAQRQPTKQIS